MKNLKIVALASTVATLCVSMYGMNQNNFLSQDFIEEVEKFEYVQNIQSYRDAVPAYVNITSHILLKITCNNNLEENVKKIRFAKALGCFFNNNGNSFTHNLVQQIKHVPQILEVIDLNHGQVNINNYEYCINDYAKNLEKLTSFYNHIFSQKENIDPLNDNSFNKWKEDALKYFSKEINRICEDNLGSDFMDQINKNINGLNNLQNNINKLRNEIRQDIDEMPIIEENIITLEDENNVSSQEVPCQQPFEYQEDVNNNNINQHDNSEDETGIDVGNEDSSSEDSNVSDNESSDSYERPDFKNNRLVKGQEYKNLLDDLPGEESSEDNSDNDDDSSYE